MGLLSHRRPPQPRLRVLTAAGRRIDLRAEKPTREYAPGDDASSWQDHAWAYRDAIGEVAYAMSYLAHAVSRIRLYAAVAQPGGAEPVPLDEAAGVPPGVVTLADDALARLTGDTNVWSGLLAPFAECDQIAGEAYLVGRMTADGEEWSVRSRDSVRWRGGWEVVDTPNQREGDRLDPDTSYVARMWTPHPRWPGLADSPMRKLLAPCEELQLVSRAVRAAARSRLAGAGLLFLPDGLTVQRPAGTDPEADPEAAEGADAFLGDLTRAMLTPLADEGDASAVVPLVVTGDPEQYEKIRHLLLESNLDPTLGDRADRAIRRIGAGLDVPPEVVTGMADLNHWTAWQVSAETIKQHVEPAVLRMCSALTATYLRDALAMAGVAAPWDRQVVLWYSVDPLVVRPNRGTDALEGHRRLAISDAALVEALGFDPDHDMPDENELMRRVAIERGAVDAPMMEAVLRAVLVGLDVPRHLPQGQITVHSGVDAQDAETAKPSPSPPGPAAPPLPAGPGTPSTPPADPDAGTPGPTTGLPASGAPARVLRAYRGGSRALARVDTTARERLATAATAAVDRAIERAAARARTLAQRDPAARANLAATAPSTPAATFRALAAFSDVPLDPEDLLAGAWTALAAQWAGLTEAARDAALARLSRIGVDLTDAQRAELAARLDEAATAGWAWLAGALTALAVEAIRDPEGGASLDGPGEDPGRPGRLTSLARAALALAGGAPVTSGGYTADGVLAQPGHPGGIASGDILGGFIRGQGQEIVAYEWVYGVSVRPFRPHYDLDGVVFRDFASPALANTDPSGWPSSTLAPGDHVGCHCDSQPIWADGTGSSADLDLVGDLLYDPSYLDLMRGFATDDTARGLTGTTPQKIVAEADRVASHRPSRRA